MSTNASPMARRGSHGQIQLNNRRRSSFETHASGTSRASKETMSTVSRQLEQRVLKQEAKRKELIDSGQLNPDDPSRAQDQMEPAQLELLNTPPEERETQQIDDMVQLLSKLLSPRGSFMSALDDKQQTEIARVCLYHWFGPGDVVCDADEETAFFFVILHGAVVIEERQVHHQEGMRGTESQMRTRTFKAGRGFHHFPLVMQSRFYEYSARVDSAQGASILLISKADYVSYMRRSVEKEMTETVTMLKATPFFSSWSDTSMSRLYFWFEKKKMPPEQDVVRQGEEADFCFIIRSGRCDVLVEIQEEEPGVGSPKGSNQESFKKSSDRRPSCSDSEGASPQGQRGGESPSAARAAATERKNLLKLAAAAAFKGNQEGTPPLRVNMRHIVTLRPGAIVGEIALFKDGVKRMATVRTSDHVELLILDKKSFLDLDRATLNIISENARYNAACTKEPGQRTRDDLQILQQRTAHLSHLSSLSVDVHMELCRVMRYRKVNEHTLLVRKGMPASCLYVLISGSASTYVTEPRRRWSATVTNQKDARLRRRNVSVEAFHGMKPTETLHAGAAIGEDELLQEDPVHMLTAVTNEPVELMEIDRHDFDRILKADRTSERGRLIEFVGGLSMMSGISVAAIHGLTNAVVRKTYMRDQLCLAHPPDPTLGSASFSPDHVYLIFSGEARLMCGADADDHRPAPRLDAANDPTYGPLLDAPPPNPLRVERHLGNAIVPVATLGPGECISENLLPSANARWCLKPITQMELVVVPKKEWSETLRIGARDELRDLAHAKARFFLQHLEHTVSQTSAMHQAVRRPAAAASPRARRLAAKGRGSLSARGGNAYAAIASPRLDASSPRSQQLMPLDGPTSPRGGPLSPGGSPARSPRKGGADLPPMGASGKIKGPQEYTPAIRLGRSSMIAMRPLHSGL